ncbi:hypothetical protein ACFX2I_001113 [Malus domestica]
MKKEKKEENRKIDSNDGFSSSDCEETIVSSPVIDPIQQTQQLPLAPSMPPTPIRFKAASRPERRRTGERENKDADKAQNGPPPGPVVSSSLNPKRSIKSAPSSVAVGKRKRDEKPMVYPSKKQLHLKQGRLQEREFKKERETIAWPLPTATVWLL